MSAQYSRFWQSALRPPKHKADADDPGQLATKRWEGLRGAGLVPALTTAAGTAALFAIYELAKQFLFPGITVWHSHAITILGAAVLAGCVAYLVTLRRERLYRRALVELGRRQRAEDDLARISSFQKLLMDAIGEGVYGLDEAGNAIFVNRAAAELLGFSPDELIGQPMHPLLHSARSGGDACQASDCPMAPTFHSLVPWRGTEIFSRKDGSQLPVEFVSSPFINQGRTAGVVVAFHEARQSKGEAAP